MKKTNRLITEKSPYLLQHAYNPVDWFPWGVEAFNKALMDDKPIFLSIGYSTCHWCHVMEKESFEDNEVAELMNAAFISIKVDREERPDIDGIYMSACQMLTGSGGWPLTIIMTPDKKPFFAGTYFSKESRFGRIGMKDLVPQIKKIWDTNRTKLLESAEKISSAIISSSSFLPGNLLDEKIFNIAFNDFEARFDKIHGGFGNATKFPIPHNLMFLLRYWKRYKNPKALEMVEKTLVEMRKGGIYDHIGFGFSRYSTDNKWFVPHFEKMLYDQALITLAYVEVLQITKNDFYKKTIEEILLYVMKKMTSEEGGFFSAEDADSEGAEGKFYLWTSENIKKVLGEEAELFIDFFNVKEEGNWIDSFHGTMDNSNILYIKESIEHFANKLNINPEEVNKRLETARRKLFKEREKRIHPYKDDKILTDWNGLMIAAFAKAAQVLNKKEYIEPAVKAADFILEKMFDEKGRFLHRYRDNEASIYANVDDFAFFIASLLDLYETTFEVKYLEQAFRLNNNFLENFWDDKNGGFFFTPSYGEKLITRQKEIYDGAVPSGNSIAMLNLIRFGRITGDIKFETKAFIMNKLFSSQVDKYPAGFTQLLIALDFAIGPSKEIIIAGNDSGTYLPTIFENFIPAKIVLHITSENDNLIKISPYLKEYISAIGRTKVFICENYVCKQPVDTKEALKQLMV